MMPMLGRRRGKNWFVNSSTGSDSNNGLTSATPFATIHKAASNSSLAPGDTVIIYPGSGYVSAATQIDQPHSGTASGWITFTGAYGTTPILTNSATSTGASDHNNVCIYPLNYTCIQGLKIISTGTGQTVGIEGGLYTNSPLYHHFIVRYVTVSGMNADGILFNSCDYVTVSGCTATACGSGDSGGPAGIHLFSFSSYDNYTGYHNKIVGNVVYANKQQSGTIIDGEGIIIDDFNGDQKGYSAYTGSTQVINNLCWHNGSAGILAFDSAYVDIYMNTCWENQQNLSNGEIAIDGAASACHNIHVWNNIVVPSGSHTQIHNVGGTGVTGGYNCRYGGTVGLTGAGDITGNPNFISASTGFTANFQLSGNSPCINAGNGTYAINFDLSGVVRPQGTTYCIGCFEYI